MSDQQPATKMVLTIVGKQLRTSQTTGKQFLSVATQAQGTFSVWDANLFDLIPASGICAAEVKVNGNYKNIVGIAPGQPMPPPAPAPSSGADPRQWSITRQVALKAAVDTWGPTAANTNTDVGAILAIANQFHAWLLATEDGEIF